MKLKNFPFDDEKIMRKAIRLALKATGKTDPNPLVGAVLVDASGNIISQGYHKKPGSHHAEAEALKNIEQAPTGSTLFVTLEPCLHHGKTPPCTDLIIAKGIKRVVIGSQDPNPIMSGKGIAQLRSAGVEVRKNLLQEECRNINRIFNKHILQHKPYVCVKVGISLDGKIALESGESQWITPLKARKKGHQLRSSYASIAVGINTLLQDDPMLNDRDSSSPQQPIRIVFDSRGKTPKDSNFLSAQHSPRILFTGSQISQQQLRLYQEKDVTVYQHQTPRPNLTQALQELYQKGICSLLVEGGSQLIAAFLSEGLIDRLHIFQSGKILGEEGKSWCGGLSVKHLNQAPEYTITKLIQHEDFIEIIADISTKDLQDQYGYLNSFL